MCDHLILLICYYHPCNCLSPPHAAKSVSKFSMLAIDTFVPVGCRVVSLWIGLASSQMPSDPLRLISEEIEGRIKNLKLVVVLCQPLQTTSTFFAAPTAGLLGEADTVG